LKTGFWAGLLLYFSISSALAAAPFPSLTGRVVDLAGMISPQDEASITRISSQLEGATGNQFIVVTLPDLGGDTIEEYGFQLGRHWGIGQSEKNNGLLLIIAKAERRIRIEVGYGLEGEMTDAIASQIIQGAMVPSFRAGTISSGILLGAQQVAQVVSGDYEPQALNQRGSGQGRGLPNATFLVLFVIIMGLRMFSGFSGGFGRRRRHRGALVGGVYGTSGGFSRGGFGGGGFGGGGFSGGGGGFGGGGASGGW